jgi:hypothetical protein
MDSIPIYTNCLYVFRISGRKLGKISRNFFLIIHGQHLPGMHIKRRLISHNLVRLLSLEVLQLTTMESLQEVSSIPSAANISLYLRLQICRLSAFCSA